MKYFLGNLKSESRYSKVYKITNDKSINRIAKIFDIEKRNNVLISEFMIINSLCHPNIIELHDIILSSDCSSEKTIGMHEVGLILNKETDDLLNFSCKISYKKLIYQLLNGLNYLHKNFIIHNDIKPHNIVITFNNQNDFIVKYIDFGLSEYIFNGKSNHLGLYTIAYRPPEILLKKEYSFSADIWALGCSLAELHLRKFLFYKYYEDDSQDEIRMLDEITKGIDFKKEDIDQYQDFDLSKNLLEKNKCYIWKSFKNYELRSFLKKLICFNSQDRLSANELLKDDYILSSKSNNKDLLNNTALTETNIRNIFQKISSKITPNVRIIVTEWLLEVSKENLISFNCLAYAIILFDYFEFSFEKEDYQALSCCVLNISSIILDKNDLGYNMLSYLTDFSVSIEKLKLITKKILKMFLKFKNQPITAFTNINNQIELYREKTINYLQFKNDCYDFLILIYVCGLYIKYEVHDIINISISLSLEINNVKITFNSLEKTIIKELKEIFLSNKVLDRIKNNATTYLLALK